MNDCYETNITDARWIAYDTPGNVGWIVYEARSRKYFGGQAAEYDQRDTYYYS